MHAHRLVVVDDDPNICRLLVDVGEKAGFEVQAVNSIVLAQDAFKKFTPTLIVMELAFPDGDGIEFFRFLSKEKSKTQIILMSGRDERIRTIALQLGQSYGLEMVLQLPKPSSLSTIESILKSERQRVAEASKEALIEAIKNHNFVLHYQPLISFKTQEVIGAEVLVRWKPPLGEMFFPDAFIPLAERENLIKPLTHWVIEQAFKQISSWAYEKDFMININLSPKVLSDISLADEIIRLSSKFKIKPENICFEVTESGIMSQPNIAMDILTRLRIRGCKISIDDFGTGYSSLVELRRLPFTEMKIDKSFVTNIEKDTQSFKISKSIIELGHSLDLTIVAEGIETKGALDKLTELGCDYAQGYYISKPINAEQFEHWLHMECDKNWKVKWKE